jgi:hypothetical protein
MAILCSCHKKDSLSQEQLAQRKVELDSRDEELARRKDALDEREKTLVQREQALAKKEQTMINAQISATDAQAETSDSARTQAEKDEAIKELSALIQGHSQVDGGKAEKQSETQNAQQQFGADEFEKLKQRKLEATKMSPRPK